MTARNGHDPLRINTSELVAILSGKKTVDHDTLHRYPDFWRRFLKRSFVEEFFQGGEAEQPLRSFETCEHAAINIVAAFSTPSAFKKASPAVFLPVCWKQAPHNSQLPETLRNVADNVKKELTLSPSLRERLLPEETEKLVASSGLHWAFDDWANIDLRALKLSADSAYAALASGLIAELMPDVNFESNALFVTGTRSRNRKGWAAGAMPQKVQAAIALNFNSFVFPYSKENSHFQTVKDSFKAQHPERNDVPKGWYLAESEEDLFHAVQSVFTACGSEPERIFMDDDCRNPLTSEARAWYLMQANNETANNFYDRKLLPGVVAKNQPVVDGVLGGDAATFGSVDYLLSTVSHSIELTYLSLKLLNPKQTTLFLLPDRSDSFSGDEVKRQKQEIERKAFTRSSVKPEFLEVENSTAALADITKFVQQIPRSLEKTTVIDLMPGKRSITLAMLEGAQPRDYLLSWWTDTDRVTKRVVPGSEKIIIHQVQADRSARMVKRLNVLDTA